LTEFQQFAEKRGENPMATPENKAALASFVEEVINEGRLERADNLVAVDFVELDPIPGLLAAIQPLHGGFQRFNASAYPFLFFFICLNLELIQNSATTYSARQ
jgi:hypothetical protein